MLLKFINQWKGHKPGTFGDFPDGMATTLIKRGYAQEYRRKTIETAMLAPPETTAVKRGRGRPRKIRG